MYQNSDIDKALTQARLLAARFPGLRTMREGAQAYTRAAICIEAAKAGSTVPDILQAFVAECERKVFEIVASMEKHNAVRAERRDDALRAAGALARRFPIPIFQGAYRRVAVNATRCEYLVGDELEKLEADVFATVAKMRKWAGE